MTPSIEPTADPLLSLVVTDRGGDLNPEISPETGADSDGDFAASITFPLERPRIRRRRRRREPVLADTALPYFLCGPENRLVAYAATADISVLRIGNPVVLIGPSGVGKTAVAMHLAARTGISLGAEQGDDDPAETVYIPGSDLIRDYAEAIEVNDLSSLQHRLLDPPVLILDDVDDMTGKFSCQGEVGRRLDDRVAAGRLTFMTSRRSLDQLAGFDESLVSRLMSGLTIPLTHPTAHTRRRLMTEFSIAAGLELTPAWVRHMEQAMPRDSASPAIEGLVRQLSLRMVAENRPIDLEMIDDVLGQTPLRPVVTMEKIVRVTGRHFGITTAQMRGPSRRRTTVKARWMAMWLCRRLTETSTHKIGEHFGGRDHTSVMHGLAKIDAQLPENPDLQTAAARIEDHLIH